MTQEKKILLLEDDKPGHSNQIVGVAQALKKPYTSVNLQYNKFSKLPNSIKGASLMGIEHSCRKLITHPWPDIVLSAGRKTVPVARYIKKQSPSTKLVHIMWPGKYHREFSLIATPIHDKKIMYKNVIETIGSPNHITQKTLDSSINLSKFSYLPQPRIALLVGGGTKKGPFTEADAHQLAIKASLFLHDCKGSLLVTTSRRTENNIINTIKHGLAPKFFFHDYNKEPNNPYLEFLATCDAIIVTGDSISMCSESCTTGKPVYIYAPPELISKKHAKFHQKLYQEQHAKPLSGSFEPWQPKPLNDAELIANEIINRFFKN